MTLMMVLYRWVGNGLLLCLQLWRQVYLGGGGQWEEQMTVLYVEGTDLWTDTVKLRSYKCAYIHR